MTLVAWLDGMPVARLEDAGPGYGLSLRYTDEAIAKHGEGALLLSLRLPVRREAYPSVAAKYFLDGLLPEDHVRAALANKARLATEDTYGLLRAYGLDCAGAVQVTEPDQGPQTRAGGILWLSDDGLAQAVSGLPAAPLGIGIDPGVRSSLGGMQGKLAVVVDGGRIGVPLDGEPSTHILKPARINEDGTELWPGIAAGENFCLQLIRAAGGRSLKGSAAESRVLSIGGRRAILVKRFDREGAGEELRRVHQEDLAQALGTNQKYQTDSLTPPRLVDVGRLLRRTASIRDVTALFERIVLGTVLGDCDMHARNLSVVLDGGKVALSPAYDVVPTSVWPEHDRELALRIGTEISIDEVSGGDLLEEAGEWGIRAPAARSTLLNVLAEAERLLPVILARSHDEGWHDPVLGDLVRQAQERIKRLAPESRVD
ncbi:HipA domain-containing protein [Zhihengliuella halotolerans]|uniref:HipA domain-containing protein n=1 Tax=Zhihengliuella halotolerans TaxID=370736 RepID=UPI000C80B330|nr:HipA domain-containing protein [Zhihengliuella halotolerans]